LPVKELLKQRIIGPGATSHAERGRQARDRDDRDDIAKFWTRKDSERHTESHESSSRRDNGLYRENGIGRPGKSEGSGTIVRFSKSVKTIQNRPMNEPFRECW
jgi:hypothetical protein